jgi:hypothetical protein
MNRGKTAELGRRRTIALLTTGLATTALAGCLTGGGTDDGTDGDDSDSDGTDGTTATGASNGGSGDESAASCGRSYGDEYAPYEGKEDGWVVSFDVPTAGEFGAEDYGSQYNTASWTFPDGDGNAAQRLVVSQTGPREDDANRSAQYVTTSEWEDGGTVTIDGSERTIAVKRTEDFSVIYFVSFESPDGPYAVKTQASVVTGDRCPEEYETVCRIVTESLSLR